MNIKYEDLGNLTERAKVPGGWIVRIGNRDVGIMGFFLPDPDHKWCKEWQANIEAREKMLKQIYG